MKKSAAIRIYTATVRIQCRVSVCVLRCTYATTTVTLGSSHGGGISLSCFFDYGTKKGIQFTIFKSVTVDGEVPHHPLCLFYFSIIHTRPAPPVLPAERRVHTASVEIVVGPASAVSVRTGTVRAAESGLFGYFCKKPKYGLIGTAAG